ncbi:MAG: hypothetical protein CVV42_06940 [Candidatus Riflebacteria bacterium HGW-Riflebacteria-2]|jgi:uncharacterized membrane protein|nr:MAG: hypothetical protein CVV42_06940 [Candidatus Riflebacteria bacterium HGW-Riflebacteria-2]
MSDNDWFSLAGEGCFYVFRNSNSNGTHNAFLSQSFSTPEDPTNIRVGFDHRERYQTINTYRLHASIRNAGGTFPNETIASTFFDETAPNPAHTGAWIRDSYDITLPANSNYIYRVFYHFVRVRDNTTGVYVDNLRIDFSPTGLGGGVNGTSNELSWNTSTTPATDVSLRGTNPYRLYWGTTSGTYTNSSLVTTNNFSHTPPAGSVVYYVVTDFDSNDVESPYSVEWPIIRQTVRDGSGADVDTIIGNDVAMNWAHVAVTGFTRTGYQVALGSTPGGSDVAGWVDLAAADTSYTFAGAALTNGNTYYTSVRMVTDRGTLNYSASDGFVSINLDVRDGSAADVDTTTSLTDADMNWGPAPFPVGRYDVALGTTPGGTDIVGWTNVNLLTSHSFSSLSLSNGASYYCSVRAYDPGMTEIGVFFSDGFAPILSSAIDVWDGPDPGVDVDDIFSLSSVDLNWQAAGFPVVRYEAALGTTPGDSDVIGWTDMGVLTSGTLNGSLATSTTYFCSVRIVHAMGTLPASSSDGFVCRKFEVRDGLSADIDYTFAADTLQANWDAVTVPLLRYDAAVGTTPGGTDVVGWTSAGTATNITFSGLAPLAGLPTIYYVSVRIISPGGVPIATNYSNGIYRIIVVDMTVRDGLNPDIEYSYFEDRAEMNWDHPAVGIIRYEVALGTSKFSDNIHPFIDVGHARQAALTGLSLASGTRYFATVRGISAIGEVEAFGSSDGFIACRDQVLTDTAAQTYFHNARVLRMIDTTTDPGLIQPRTFSANGGGTQTWARHLAVDIEEPGVTERINAPCRIQLAGLTNVVANAIRVADDQGNEVPRHVLASTANSMDLVFLVNIAKSETRTYWIYWDNATAGYPGAYGFTDTATNLSFSQWTPYYSRKNMPPGNENVTLGGALSNGDDVYVALWNLPWNFYFFGTNITGWRMNTNGYMSQNTVVAGSQYRNRWATFESGAGVSGGNMGKMISPLWCDLWPGGGAPQNDGIYRNAFADRVVFTWRANRFGVRDDIYIFQAVLYQTSDIAFKYDYLSTLGLTDGGSYDMPVNTENTVGISNCDGNRWLINTPLITGIGKTPTAFYQCSDAFRNSYTAGAPQGGAGWVEVAHIESMIFDSRTASPIWQRIEYDCSVPAGNQLVISTRSGSTPLPEMGGWTGWIATATVAASGNTALTSTDRYIQYRVGFERNNHAAALAQLERVSFIHGGISIEEIKGPESVTQGQTNIPVTVTIKNFYTSPVDLTNLGLSFSLGSYTQTLVEPAVPGTQITAGGTITATFSVNVAIDSPIGTATVEAFASATSGIYTFEDSDAQTPHDWWVRSRARLSIIKVETEPTFVNKGQSDILVNMLIANLGETPYYFNGASLTFSLGEYVPQTGSLTTYIPLATDDIEIPALSEFTAIFTVTISPTSDSGFVAVIGGTASGTDVFSGLNTDDITADITDSWTIQNPAALVLEEVIASATVYRGQTNTPVLLRVSNMGEATAIWEYSDLNVPPYFATGTYDAFYNVTPFDITLPGYMEATARYGVDISPNTATCTDSVNANVYGSDTNSGSVLKWESGALLPATWTIRAEILNTFKDPAYAFPSASFNKPAAGSIIVYARGQNVNPYAEYVFRWIDPSNNTLLVSSPITADASGTMYHQFDITPLSAYGDYKVRITNPTNTIIAVENVFEVTSPAVLSGIFELPAQVSVGQPFIGSMTFINTGGAKIESGYVSPLDLNTALLASLDSGPDPAVIDVEGDNQATTTYQFTALAPGNFSASATIYGFDANDGTFLISPSFTSTNCLIQTAPSLTTVSVTAVPTVVYLNQKNLRVEVVIRNNGQATAVLEAASLTFNLGQYQQAILSPAFPYELAGNNTTVTIIYDISVNPDSPTSPPDDTFYSNLLWHDKNWPESGGYLTGAAPTDGWTINPIGILLASNLSYTPTQDDFNRLQTVYIRCYGFAAGAQWYRVRLYDSEVPQAGNSPLGWENVSPQLAADADGYIDHLYTIEAADTLGTWTVIIDTGNGTTGGPKQSIQYFKVQLPGNLLASLTIAPTEVFVGDEFTVTMLASNTVANGSTISNASPTLLIPASAFPNFAGSATLLSGPTPASATIRTGKTKQFTWTYRADSNTGMVGSFSLTVDPAYYAAGYDLNTAELRTSNKAVSNRLLIYSRDLGLSSATIDFGSMECGDSKMIGPTQVVNLGNYNLDDVKWITTDLNGTGMLKITRANLSMSPELIGGIAAGSARDATATLFIPYNKEADDYVATMSVYQDLNGNNLFDLGELYDFFAIKVTVPPCKRVFAVQDIVDLGGCSIGKDTLPAPVNVFSGGNIPLDNVRFMALPGATHTFVIDVNPTIYGPVAMTGSFVASATALNVNTDGYYIATWTVWDDWHNPGSVDADEASDTFQIHIQVGEINYNVVPALVNAGTIEPSQVISGIAVTLNNLGTLPLVKLKFDPQPLVNATLDVIGSDSIAIDGALPTLVDVGGNAGIDLIIFAPAGMAVGTYTAPQYFYYDDNLNNAWDTGEFRASFDLQVEVLPVAKVQVLTSTVGLGGISRGTSKVVSFNCRNTGNIPLTDLRWEKVLLLAATDTIPAGNASFPPSELFSVPAGQFFTREIMVTVPPAATFGIYNSIPGHFWLYADMPPTNNGLRDAIEAQANFMVNCEVGELKVQIDNASLSSTGGPNALSSPATFDTRNIGSLNLANLKATATVLIPSVPGPINIPASANVINSASIGALNVGQFKQSTWRVNVPPNASAATYIGTLTVWEDANGNGLNESAEASATVPIELIVTSTRAIDVTTTLLDLQYVGRNSSKSGTFEIRNVGNIDLTSLLSQKTPLIFGASNIPVGNITFLLPSNSLAVGAAMTATVTVSIGPVQAAYTYNGMQTIFEDHLAPVGSWSAGEASDTFQLRISVGEKSLYVSNPANPPLNFGPRAVNANYTANVTVYNSSPIPLPMLDWQVSALTGSSYTFPVASLTFTPSAPQSIGATPANYTWQANLQIGQFVPPGNYIATATVFDDETSYNGSPDATEASATINVLLTVNATHSLMIVDSALYTELNIVDFGTIAQGEPKSLDITFQNTGNVELSNYSWIFSDINHSTLPGQMIDASQISYALATPVAPGAYGTIEVTIDVPAGQAVGTYGPTGGQSLFAATPAAASDDCEFQCEITPSSSAFFEMAEGSVYQEVATSTFAAAAPANLYFLSAWVCPGSGSADLAIVQYDVDGKAVATAAVRITPDGNVLAMDSPGFTIKHRGVSNRIPIDMHGESFSYIRVYLGFDLTFDPTVASHTTINLQNSSADSPRSVWFDGIQLEKGDPGQTRPVAYHDRATIHSPNRKSTMEGRHKYYEW